MKKLIASVLALVCMLGLIGCSKTYNEESLIDLAREELPISDADNIDLIKAGIVTHDEKALVWFISGNDYQEHYYLPLEMEMVGDGRYTYFHTHNPRERHDDIAYIPWGNGFAVCVNDPNCVKLHLENDAGQEWDVEIEDGNYPFVAYYKTASTILFFDKDGNQYQ